MAVGGDGCKVCGKERGLKSHPHADRYFKLHSTDTNDGVMVRVTPHSKKTSVVQCQHADEVGVSADGRTVGTSRHTLNTGAASLPCELGGESLYCASE